ncbi:MAG: hypothetical protein JWR09_2587 [Mucilaginibacter sp.]|nr:hypothetical protein [Mucilaginibacter sp.]
MEEVYSRRPYLHSEIEAIRKRVATAYLNCTNQEFLSYTYKYSHSYKTLIGLLDGCGEISNSTLRKFFTAKPNVADNNCIEKFSEKTIKILNCFADKHPITPSETDSQNENAGASLPRITHKTIQTSNADDQHIEEEIRNTHKNLLEYNNNDDIPTGRLEAEKAFKRFGYSPIIIKDLFRFNMRLSKWGRISQVIEECKIEQSDELKTIFELGLAESKIKEAYQYKHDKLPFQALLKEADTHIGLVPISFQESENYYYWTGRYYLESWWITWKSGNVSLLGQALDNFTDALKLAGPNAWWLLAYICIVKNIQDKNFKTDLDTCKTAVIKRRNLHQRLVSAKIYLITSQILEDICCNKNDLPVLLKSISKPNSTTDFEDTILHHVELIFYKEEKMSDRYKSIIKEWLD